MELIDSAPGAVDVRSVWAKRNELVPFYFLVRTGDRILISRPGMASCVFFFGRATSWFFPSGLQSVVLDIFANKGVDRLGEYSRCDPCRHARTGETPWACRVASSHSRVVSAHLTSTWAAGILVVYTSRHSFDLPMMETKISLALWRSDDHGWPRASRASSHLFPLWMMLFPIFFPLQSARNNRYHS